MDEATAASKSQSTAVRMLALNPAAVHKSAMSRPRRALLCLLLLGGAVLRAAPGEVSKEDLAELESLRLKVRESTAEKTPGADNTRKKATPDSADLAELAALKARIDAAATDHPTAPTSPTGGNVTVRAQVIRPDEDGTGFELVLVLDAAVPTPAVMRGTGHAVGEKIEVEGRFEGAAKFEGAYYPFLKTPTPAEAETAKKKAAKSAGPAAPSGENMEKSTEEDEGFGGFQISNLLFAVFGTVSLAIVLLKAKAAVDARKAKKNRRRR